MSGSVPQTGGLTVGPDGAFYGTTLFGGDNDQGTVYRVSTNGNLTVVASFDDASGYSSYSRLVLGDDGSFYGTSYGGGSNGVGTIYRVTTNGSLMPLLCFNNANGANPAAGLLASHGAFYGTTAEGGAYGDGTLFKWTTNGALTTLVSFDRTNGWSPQKELIEGSDGALYGTAYQGGSSGDGTVFRLTTNGVFTVLASLDYNETGQSPNSGVIFGIDGALYGTAEYGGTRRGGTVFRVRLNPLISDVVVGSGSATVTGRGLPEVNYLIEGTDSLFPSSWKPVGSSVANSNQLFQINDSGAAGHKSRFYRASTSVTH